MSPYPAPMGNPMPSQNPPIYAGALPYQPALTTRNSPIPIRIKCDICGNIGVTNVLLKAGRTAWIWCLVMGFTTGCCCIPFCIDNCQDRCHYCSKCGAQVGVNEAEMC
jgi:lipopolysaccharide-induced tumor necrosis factor-alpha factor